MASAIPSTRSAAQQRLRAALQEKEEKKKTKRQKPKKEEEEEGGVAGIDCDTEDRSDRRFVEAEKKKMEKAESVWRMLETGVPLMFEGMRRPKPKIIREIRTSRGAQKILADYIEEQLQLGFVREESGPATVISPIFAIPKKEEGQWRVIVDLRYVNKSQKIQKFKHENFDTLGLVVRKGDFMTKGDIKHGFHHLEMTKESIRYLGFRDGTKYYSYVAMPMGSSSSPYVFYRMVKPAIQYIREKMKIRIVWYVDDFLVMGSSKDEAEENMIRVTKLLRELGWHMNWKKSDFEAKQQQTFLGLVVIKFQNLFHIPSKVPSFRAFRSVLILSSDHWLFLLFQRSEMLSNSTSRSSTLRSFESRRSCLSISRRLPSP